MQVVTAYVTDIVVRSIDSPKLLATFGGLIATYMATIIQ